MLTKTLAAAVLGFSLAAIPAYAQNTQNQNQANASKEQPHQTASQANLWPSSKITGLNVYDQKNEKIGSITDLMLSKDGKIDMVVIGVGGFLGIGEHDVAVKFSELKWEMEPVKTATSSSAPAGGGGAMNRPAGGTVGTASSASSNQPKQFWPDHALLNTTKDQLKSMPQFDSTK